MRLSVPLPFSSFLFPFFPFPVVYDVRLFFALRAFLSGPRALALVHACFPCGTIACSWDWPHRWALVRPTTAATDRRAGSSFGCTIMQSH
jgi:hypothetical protein